MSTEERLPEGWMETTLGDICIVIMGQSPPSSEYNEDGEGLPFFQGKAEFTDLYPQVKKWCTSPMKIAEADDILLSVRAPVGPTNIAPSRCCIGRGLAAIRPEGSIDFHYTLYAIRNFNASLTQIATGTTFEAISGDDIKAFRLPLAPLPEQNRIVAAIEQQFTRLDSAVASLQSARVRAKQYRASLLKAAVEGELTKEWRAAHPASETGTQLLARIMAERRVRWEEEQLAKIRELRRLPKDDKWKQAYKEPQGPDVENLPELPEGWCWATVEQLASPEPRSIQSGPFGSALLHSEFQESGILAIGIDNVLNGRFSMGSQHRISPEKYEKLKKFTARPLDILITVMATVGRCCVVPVNLETAIITKHVYRISANQIIISPHFLALCLYGGSEVRNQLFGQVQGQTRPGINGEILKRIAIPVPPLAEQEQIVAEVEAKLSNIAQMEETIEANLKRAEHERQSILREAFAGRLVPQDPEDEPASVLLEHISEERKKREEAEKIARVSRKRIQMESTKKRRAGKANLYTTLVEAKRSLSPDDLFKRAGLKTDEQLESVKVFYEELHADVNDALIKETRPDDAHVLLEALEPSAEVLARMAEAEAARQAQEAEPREETIDAPTLWIQ